MSLHITAVTRHQQTPFLAAACSLVAKQHQLAWLICHLNACDTVRGTIACVLYQFVRHGIQQQLPIAALQLHRLLCFGTLHDKARWLLFQPMV
jgi:hypothetical protein